MVEHEFELSSYSCCSHLHSLQEPLHSTERKKGQLVEGLNDFGGGLQENHGSGGDQAGEKVWERRVGGVSGWEIISRSVRICQGISKTRKEQAFERVRLRIPLPIKWVTGDDVFVTNRLRTCSRISPLICSCICTQCTTELRPHKDLYSIKHLFSTGSMRK